MFIELSEFLRCPHEHDERTYCVIMPEVMDGRRVVRGTIACPVCRREYPVREAVADFGAPERADALRGPAPPPAPETVQALLGLAGPGGYVVLLGSAARLADPLAARMEGIHFVGVNAPPDVEASVALSLVRGANGIPLASAMARGVVVGREAAAPPWLEEAARITLRGLRIVVCDEDARVPAAEAMAAGEGLWVGKKL